MILDDKIMKKIKKMQKQAAKKRCLLCKRKSVTWGMFFTEDQKYNVPAGKTRAFIYGICAKCHASPDRNERVEKALSKKKKTVFLTPPINYNAEVLGDTHPF